MNKERKMEKACKKEALQALKKQSQEQHARQIEQEMQRKKERISSQIDDLVKKRNALVSEAVELRKTDPKSAEYVIALGCKIDDTIKQARGVLAMANGQVLNQEINRLIDESLALMRRINTEPIMFKTEKELKIRRKEKQLHDIMTKLAQSARISELNIYMEGILPSEGKGSAFEADVLTAERKAQIEEFDD